MTVISTVSTTHRRIFDMAVMLKILALALLPSLLVPFVSSSNVLLLPLLATSHCLEAAAVGSELANRGHNVTLLVVSFFDATKCLGDAKINLLVSHASQELDELNNKMDKFLAHAFKEETQTLKALKSVSDTTEILGKLCEHYITDQSLVHKLSEARFDLAIVDGFPFARCLFALPYSLGIPTVSVSSIQDDVRCGQPFQGNTVPHVLSAFSNEMTMPERLANLVITLSLPLIDWFVLPRFDLGKFGVSLETSNIQKIFKRSLLHLENSDHIVDFPKATFPNFVQVGGLTTLPAKPLTPELERYFDNAEHGVILVAFGDTVKGAPKAFIEKLTSAFRRLKQNVIFKLDHDEDMGNVKILKWVPQRDVLGHRKLKLIVSHCGKNTFYEALYNGVPILCTPLHGDNFAIAKRVSHFRVGTSLNIISATEDEIIESVNNVLNDPSYAANMKRASALFKDRPETPRQRAASAVEHVLKYGGDHLRPGGADINIFQYTYGDVWLVISGVIVITVYLLVKVIRFICCRNRKTSSKKKKRQ
ncbi:UDP-glucuronosyltransferase 1A1-like [Gigantopelta aegis]|uniref:UDP-glucuronosyltransferase 1A1-like n=1 Tax=Gigantopelta aegis TaxID=1735272 RepID=UPI001B88C571|nr:UDP-glucuronosyltransferase 1A1-like [Gigantopelta aegis]